MIDQPTTGQVDENTGRDSIQFSSTLGLPPDGADSQFLGVDKDGRVFVLRWHGDQGWCAMGHEADPNHGFRPVALWGEAVRRHIVRSAAMPAMALPPAD